MICKQCPQFESFRTPKHLPHWHAFGHCNTANITLAENDECLYEPKLHVRLEKGGQKSWIVSINR